MTWWMCVFHGVLQKILEPLLVSAGQSTQSLVIFKKDKLSYFSTNEYPRRNPGTEYCALSFCTLIDFDFLEPVYFSKLYYFRSAIHFGLSMVHECQQIFLTKSDDLFIRSD